MSRNFKLLDNNVGVPTRATKGSAGYDLRAAEDTVIPSLFFLIIQNFAMMSKGFTLKIKDVIFGLDEAQSIIKSQGMKATLVPTGVAIKLNKGEYADVRGRSGVSTKALLILPNGMGLIDEDFYPNEIMVPLINLSPFSIKIKKGERIAQLVIGKYLTVDGEKEVSAERTNGFNSTGTK